MFLFVAALMLPPILIVTPADISFPIIIAVVALVVGAAIYFVQPWGLILGVIGGLFGILMSTMGIDLSLSTPQAFYDFIFPVALLPASVLILLGSITGLVQHFRHQTSTGNPTVTMALKGVLGVIGILMVISAVLTVTNMGSVSAADKEGAALVTAKESKFDQTALTTTSDGKIVVRNDDLLLHTFTIDGLGIDVKVGPRSEELITLDGVSPGEYFFRCRVSGHDSMDGTLTVN
jgi:hypothetical protein